MTNDRELHDFEPEQIEPEMSALLDRWPAPVSSPQDRRQLLTVLHEAFDAQAMRVTPERRLSAHWSLLILLAQLRIIHGAIWIGTALVLSLGVLVTLLTASSEVSLAQLPLVLLAPLVAGVGAAFLYGEGIDPPLELQQTTPIRPALVVLARLILLFTFNMAIAAGGSVLLALTHSEISLVPLIAAWLAPMLFLSTLAFVLSVIWFDARLSVGIALGLWTVTTWRHFASADLLPPLVSGLPDILSIEARPLLVLCAVIFIAAGLWISEREERHLRT